MHLDLLLNILLKCLSRLHIVENTIDSYFQKTEKIPQRNKKWGYNTY